MASRGGHGAPSTDIYKYSQKLRTSSSIFFVELTGSVAASMMHTQSIRVYYPCVAEADSGEP
jgi:hypothetical protein